MDWTAAKVLLDATALVISIGVGIYAWWANRNRARHSEITALREADQALQVQIAANAARMDVMDRDVANTPSHKDIDALRQTVADLSGHVRELNGSMKTVNRFVDMMNEHLLNAAGGRRD